MDIDKDTKEAYEKYTELAYKWHDLFANWIKTIVAISAGLISVLVSLKQTNSETTSELLLFSTSIIGLTIGILSGVILLHRHIELIEKSREWHYNQLLKRLSETSIKGEVDILKVGAIYKICEYVFYSSLTMSLLALTTYAILKDSNSLQF